MLSHEELVCEMSEWGYQTWDASHPFHQNKPALFNPTFVSLPFCFCLWSLFKYSAGDLSQSLKHASYAGMLSYHVKIESILKQNFQTFPLAFSPVSEREVSFGFPGCWGKQRFFLIAQPQQTDGQVVVRKAAAWGLEMTQQVRESTALPVDSSLASRTHHWLPHSCCNSSSRRSDALLWPPWA